MKKFLCALLISLLGMSPIMALPEFSIKKQTKKVAAYSLGGIISTTGAYLLGSNLAKTHFVPAERNLALTGTGICAFLVASLWGIPRGVEAFTELMYTNNAAEHRKKPSTEKTKEEVQKQKDGQAALDAVQWANRNDRPFSETEKALLKDAQELEEAEININPSEQNPEPLKTPRAQYRNSKKSSPQERAAKAKTVSFYTNLTLGTIAAVTGFYMTARSLKSK